MKITWTTKPQNHTINESLSNVLLRHYAQHVNLNGELILGISDLQYLQGLYDGSGDPNIAIPVETIIKAIKHHNEIYLTIEEK